jgi:hypothetical protein
MECQACRAYLDFGEFLGFLAGEVLLLFELLAPAVAIAVAPLVAPAAAAVVAVRPLAPAVAAAAAAADAVLLEVVVAAVAPVVAVTIAAVTVTVTVAVPLALAVTAAAASIVDEVGLGGRGVVGLVEELLARFADLGRLLLLLLHLRRAPLQRQSLPLC